MPYIIKEPTYSERETEVYRGCCKIVNNIVCRKELFKNFTMTEYSKVLGMLVYIIAGWGKSGDVDLAVQIIDRYGKELEEKHGNKYAVKELKVINSSYKAIRKATEKFQKTSLDVYRIMDCQAEQLLKICGIIQTASKRKFILDNIQCFINYYLDKSTIEFILPDYGTGKVIQSDRLPEWSVYEDNTKQRGVIKDFYCEVNRYPAGWLRFHFNVRIPLGIILSIVNILSFVFQRNVFEVAVLTIIFSLDLLFLYLMMRRTSSSKIWLYIEFTYVFLISLLSLDYVYIIVVGLWTLFNYIYFGKNISFFDKEIWGRTCTLDEYEDVKTKSNTFTEHVTEAENTLQTKYCRKCGAPIVTGASFCNKCGDSISEGQKKDNVGESILNIVDEKELVLEVEHTEIEKPKESILKTQVSKLDDDMMDQLRKWKSLLDEGIINEEEFENKKKDILGL